MFEILEVKESDLSKMSLEELKEFRRQLEEKLAEVKQHIVVASYARRLAPEKTNSSK